jgi:hypothetical protein
LWTVQIIVRARLAAPPIAIQRLAGVLRGLMLRPGWSFDTTPTTVLLSAPAPTLSPDRQGYAGEVVLRVAEAKEIVRAACDGRDGIEPQYFAVDPASGALAP